MRTYRASSAAAVLDRETLPEPFQGEQFERAGVPHEDEVDPLVEQRSPVRQVRLLAAGGAVGVEDREWVRVPGVREARAREHPTTSPSPAIPATLWESHVGYGRGSPLVQSNKKKRARSSYHHGNLSAALVHAAKLLIAERGLEGFTLREVARRIGVSHVAAYRHYADRRALLAAVAERGFHQLRRRLEGARKKSAASLEPRLRAILAAYLQFCWDEPALTRVMFGPRLSHAGEFPRLEAAVENSLGIIVGAIAALAPPRVRNRSTRHMGIALWTFVHGFSTLSYDKAAYPTARQAARAFDDALTPMLVGMFRARAIPPRG